mgnify:CR=1 FL=1
MEKLGLTTLMPIKLNLNSQKYESKYGWFEKKVDC